MLPNCTNSRTGNPGTGNGKALHHSSTTYKLKLNKGDLKATQGDTGHAQIDMITGIYAHILDEDQKINAQNLKQLFIPTPICALWSETSR